MKVRVILSNASGYVGYEIFTCVDVRSNSEQSSPKTLSGTRSPGASPRLPGLMPIDVRIAFVSSAAELLALSALLLRKDSRPELGTTKARATFSPLMKSEAFLGGSGAPAFQICFFVFCCGF